MSDVEKHFICTSPGCNMSFTDEDHLAIHRKKHDMVLNLENNDKNSGFVVDQTPTPTRFIRNCEEVGLFQDLQNVNPFEETFRRAVEARNTGTLTVPGEVETTDDTLHTPHIFPHIADVLSDGTHILSETNQECSTPITVIGKPTTSKEKLTVGTQTYSDLNLQLNESHSIKENTLASSKTTALHAESIVLQHLNVSVTPKRVMQQSSSKLSINGEEVELLLKTADGKLMQLSANPIYESSQSSNTSPSHVSTFEHTKQQNVLMRSELPRINIPISESKKALPSKMTFAKMKLQQILTKKVNTKNEKSPETITTVRDNISQPSKEENSKQNIDQHRKKDLLERNRASSMRAREKRKAWVQHLQKTMTKVNETNSILESEVKALRNELTRLKTLLLAHKDCPVTKEMQKGNGVVLGTKIISVNNDSIDTTGSTNTLSIKTLPTLLPDIVNKKLASNCIKNPIILPKVVEQRPVTMTPIISSNGTIVKNIPGIELIEVTHFMAEKDNDVKQPQIMIVQNPTMRLDEGSPKRKIIRLNPNYEIRQVWSKSTTT